jgi:hypothetical protein
LQKAPDLLPEQGGNYERNTNFSLEREKVKVEKIMISY